MYLLPMSSQIVSYTEIFSGFQTYEATLVKMTEYFL